MLPSTSRSKGALEETTATTPMDHRRRSYAASASPTSASSAHDVDARITIPMASTASTITHRPSRGGSTANSKPSELLLRSGISKYRSLSGKNGSNSSGGASNATESQGGNASARAYTRGMQLMDQKQYGAAIPFFSDALLYATNNGQSTNSHSNSKKPSHAGGGVTAAPTLKIHLQRGTCYLAAQRYQAAVEDFTHLIEATPGQPALYVKRARAHAKLQHYNEALADYHEVIESLASSPTLEFAGGHAQTELRNLLLERAHVYHEMNNQTKALSDLTRAEQADGTRDATLYYQRSRIYVHIHQPTLALQDLDRVLELRSDDVLDEDHGSGDDAHQVRPALPTRLLEILLEHAKLTQQIAYENEAQQRKDVELVAVEQGESSRSAITRDQHGNGPPEGYKSSDARALLQRAITDYTQILAMDPDHIEALHKRGQAYGFLEDYDRAFADFVEALRREPGDFEVHMSRAKLFQQQGRLQDAIREVTHVIEVNGFFVDALFFRAWLFEQTEDWTKAQLDYSSIIEAQLDVQGVSTTSSKTPSTNNSGRNGSKSTSQKGSNGKASVPPPPPPPIVLPKKTSDIAAQALLLRARISLHQEDFENATADYERILKSNPNHLEAQLEKQETQTKKIECENRKQQEALMWLEEKQMLEEQLGTGVDAAGKEQQHRNGSATGKAKKKKKKKKKKPNHSAYVLLVDEEEEEVAAKTTTTVETEIDLSQVDEEHETVKIDSESELRIPSQDEEPVTVPSASRVYVAITRDEACESMWEQADEPIELKHRQRMRWRELEEEELEEEFSRQDEDAEGPKLLMDEHEIEKPSDIEVEETEDDNGEEDTGGSTTDSVGAPSTVREVLVDDKYLKKRQKQLEKLRANFLEMCLTRDRLGIEEVMERAERKQMSEQLSTEIEHAKEILESIQKQQEDVAKTIQSSLRSAGFIDIESSETHEAEPICPPRMNTTDTLRIKQQSVEQEEDPTANVNKPPSLVIRPFAYGQALQQAEQHQHQQLLHHQRLLQEKDAEIAYLRDLLSQANRAASIEQHDQIVEDGLTDRLAALRTKFPHHALHAMESRVGQLVNTMGPSPEADHVRFKILSFVHRVLEANFPPATPILFFSMGSFPMKTYLPSADLDVCLLLPKELEPSWHFAVLHALCLAGSSHPDAIAEAVPMMNGSPNGKRVTPPAVSSTTSSMTVPSHTVRNVSFINADVRVIKCTIDNVAVDVTANRTGALGALVLLDAMDVRVNQQHLLKKSLILIKSWCLHESGAYSNQAPSQPTLPGKSMGGQSVLGSSNGALSTYAINTIVVSLFNEHGPSLTHPLQALFLFLDRVAEFPWHDSAMTVHGPVALSALPTMPLRKAVRKHDPHRNSSVFLDFDEVDQMRLRLQDQFGGFEASSAATVGGSSPTLMNGGGGLKMFPIRVCNIVDPLDPYNNLGRSVSTDSFPLIKRACRMGRNRLSRMLMSPSSSASDVDEFFVNCCALYARGDGWRPDLLVHPRQTWHGVNSSSPSPVGDNDEQRWQSIVPDVLHYPVIPTATVPPFAVAPAVTTPPWSPPPAHHHHHHHHNAPRQQH